VSPAPRSYVLGGLLALTALIIPVAVAANATPAAPAGSLGPVETSFVHGDCHGGGTVILQARRMGSEFAVTATARGLPEGGTWRIALSESSATNPNINKEADGRAVVRGGQWTFSRTLPAVAAPYFDLVAFGPRKINDKVSRLCSVLVEPAAPFAGVTFCRKSLMLSMTAVYRDGIGLVVHWGMLGAKPETTWTITLQARTRNSGVAVGSQRTATGHGFLLGKDTFTDQVNPRLNLSVEAAGGQRCSLGMHRVLAHPTPVPAPRSRQTREGPRSAGTHNSELRSLFAAARGSALPTR
jgi:hypothetical protein